MATRVHDLSFFLQCVFLALLSLSAVDAAQIFMVKLEELPLVGAARLQPELRSNGHLYRAALASTHRALVSSITGSHEALLYSYSHVFNGFAAKLEADHVAKLRESAGVHYVVPDRRLKLAALPSRRRKLLTTFTPHFLGLDGAAPLGLYSKTTGRGLILGSIDTGVWPEHPSFNPRYMPAVPARFKGTCSPGEAWPATKCNTKIIGARFFGAGFEAGSGLSLTGNKFGEYNSARDSAGHGTHTASTAAGSPANVTVRGALLGTAKGMAYGAHIAVYKACWAQDQYAFSGCYDSDLVAAIEAAVLDGADVLSLSLNNPPGLLYSTDEALFYAHLSGVFAACAGGNAGPQLQSVANNAPWYLTVAASTVPRVFVNTVVLGNGQRFTGATLTHGTTPALGLLPLVYAGYVAAGKVGMEDAASCGSGVLDPRKVRGKIAICKMGFTATPFQQGKNVLAAGGAAMVLLNNANLGDSTSSDFHVLPFSNVGYDDGLAILQYIGKSKHARAYLTPVRQEASAAPLEVADFSGRGPNFLPDIMKPDVTAPGVGVLAAWPPNVPASFDGQPLSWNFLDGTSASTPHAAGSALLLRALHPDWPPSAVHSALVTTAYTSYQGRRIQDQGTLLDGSPLMYGGGHIDPDRAADPGLVYESVFDDLTLALCSYLDPRVNNTGGALFYCPAPLPPLWQYNSPAFSLSNFSGALGGAAAARGPVAVTRRVTYVGGGRGGAVFRGFVVDPPGVRIRLAPAVLSFSRAGEVLSYTATFLGTTATNDYTTADFAFGSITWSDGTRTVTSQVQVNILGQ